MCQTKSWPIPDHDGYVLTESGDVIDTVWNYRLEEKCSSDYNWYNFERIGKTTKTRKVFVREKGSDTIQAWPSLESFAREVGQKKDTLQKSIYVKKGWGKYEIWYV